MIGSVSEDRKVHGLTPAQIDTLDEQISKLCTDTIDPPIRIDLLRRTIDDKQVLLVVVPRGKSLHSARGRSYIRSGSTKRAMSSDERLRLAQTRAQGRYIWFDKQTVIGTGFKTLDQELWKPLLSAEGARDPIAALQKLALLATDDSGVLSATVAGVLLCTRHPEDWFPNARITATVYKGLDRASGQLNAREIMGPLVRQISDSIDFIVGYMHFSSRKVPDRNEMPQYSIKALFEAIVNAVVHRDYTIRGSAIRLSIFSDRIEIQSPGSLPNILTVDSMGERQSTRNRAIASIFSRIPVGGIPGTENRRFLMEQRGDGVRIIQRETEELTGKPPIYRLIDDSEVLLTIPAAPMDISPATSVITVRSDGKPVCGADVLIFYPNKTWEHAISNANGEAKFDLDTIDTPLTVFAAAPSCSATVKREWVPQERSLNLKLEALESGGSVILQDSTGCLPGLNGRLNPIRDALDRVYLYASNISIEQGSPQPVHFILGEDLRLNDNTGSECLVRIIEIVGRCSLIEYQKAN